ncbi:TetR/AcrR family transcriptional regulator [Pseudonocardia sp. CA-107938]|uniref:TetR/AcrR family transcriptional regulator n=1 Tax=Pseudonocardia sp. CA-107938 TaxID=3240021 RepID=UPI003D905D6C
MSDPVKTPRRYDASRRQAQAGETRARMLAAARDLFLEKGYAGTAMPDVARAAGVSVQAVYKAFANKASLLKTVFDVAVAGDDEAVPMADRDTVAAVIAEPDARRKIEMYTAHLAALAPRVAPVQLLVRDAAHTDPAAAAVWEQIRGEMFAAMTMFTRDLVATGRTRPDRSDDELRDLLWTYHSPEVYELLVLARGWTAQRYGEFLAEAMSAAVLATAPR